MASSASQLCNAYWCTGDVEKVVDIGSKAVHLIEEHHLEKDFLGMGYSPYSFICANYGGALGYMGRFKEATGVLEKGFRNACETDDKFMMGFAQMFHSIVMQLAGYGDNTIALAQEAIKICEEAEISLALEVAWFMLGGGYYFRGEYDKAIEAGEKVSRLQKIMACPLWYRGAIGSWL